MTEEKAKEKKKPCTVSKTLKKFQENIKLPELYLR